MSTQINLEELEKRKEVILSLRKEIFEILLNHNGKEVSEDEES